MFIDAFQVMADPVRRRIVDILASGEHTAGAIAAVAGGEFKISRTAVSKHLRILRDSGMVDVHADYQWRWYYLTEEGLCRLEDAVADLRAKFEGGLGWDTGLGRMRDPLGDPRVFDHVVRRKGPGRAFTPGRRGHQTVPPTPPESDLGMY
ncbi:MAG: metalloregulator ArsR/SmtB family transcription factor [Microbacterium sp.]